MAVLNTARSDMQTRLIEKAWKDPEFRKEVIADPKGLLERTLGQKLPEQVRIFVHEEDAFTLHLSIPPVPANVAELSDEELEKVAGGTDIVVVTAVVVAIATVTVAATAFGTQDHGW